MQRNLNLRVVEAELADLFSHYLNSEASLSMLESRIALLRDKLASIQNLTTEPRLLSSPRSFPIRAFDSVTWKLMRRHFAALREEVDERIMVLTDSVETLLGEVHSAYRRELQLAQRAAAFAKDQLTLSQIHMMHTCRNDENLSESGPTSS